MDAQPGQIKQGEGLPGVDELLPPASADSDATLDLTARGVVPLAPASWQLLATGASRWPSPCPLPPTTDAWLRLTFSKCLVGAVRFDKALNCLQVVRKGCGSPLRLCAVAVVKVDPYVKTHESTVREATSAHS
jgi:hypothetical protein